VCARGDKQARQACQSFDLKDMSMKRLHAHVVVEDITRSVGFYSASFAAKPAVIKPDYAKILPRLRPAARPDARV
jgi:hypothetical protein